MSAMRSLEQTADRASRELDIRSDLRRWDNEHPEIHHELIVRYLCGAAISIVATAVYDSLFHRPRYYGAPPGSRPTRRNY